MYWLLLVDVLLEGVAKAGAVMLTFTVGPLYMSRPAALRSALSNAWWCAPANMAGPPFCSGEGIYRNGFEKKWASSPVISLEAIIWVSQNYVSLCNGD